METQNNIVIFTNDNNVVVKLNKTPSDDLFKCRVTAEAKKRKLVSLLIHKNIITKNMVDCGSWLGDNSIPWSLNIKDRIVYAVDPSPNNCKYIDDICYINNIKNILLFNIGLCSTNRELVTQENIDHCSFVWKNPDCINNKKNIQGYALDYLFEKKEIMDIDFIHLDVEGMEIDVLNGSTKVIDSCNPVIIFEHHFLIDNNDVPIFLLNRKYRVFMINEIIKENRNDCRNFIAFPRTCIDINKIIDMINEEIEKGLLTEFVF